MKSLILVLCLSLCVQYSFGQKPQNGTGKHEITEVTATATPSEVTTTATSSEATTTANTPVGTHENTEVTATTTPSEVTTTATSSEATTTANTPGDTTTPAKNNPVANESTKAPLTTKASTATSKKMATPSDKRLRMMYDTIIKLMKQRGLFKTSQPPTTTAPPTINATAATDAAAGTGATTATDQAAATDAPPADDEDTDRDSKIDDHPKTDEGSKDMNLPGSTFQNKTPDSSHFAVVFLVLIALLFGLYALYHNRGKIIAVVVEGRSGAGNRGARDRYRKLDNNSEDLEARIKNSNEVYVY